MTTIIIDENNVKLIPDSGNLLYDNVTQKTYSVAEINKRRVKNFSEVPKEE